MKFTNRKIKFRVWTGATMEYRVLAGALGYFYVEGMSNKDSACLSEANTIYDGAAPLMQWTGLVDKNGVEIYEGDIIKTHSNFIVGFGPYKDSDYYGHNGFLLQRLNSIDSPFGFGEEYLGEVSKTTQVIGNIFQNPELLNAP